MRSRTNRRRRAPLSVPRIRLSIGWRLPAWLAGTAAVAWLVFKLAVLALDQPIRAIEIDGSFHRVSALDVEAQLAQDIGRGFFSADLRAMRLRLEALPWVDSAHVQRRWPDTLRVSVAEHVAAARWGESGLLNVRGELFIRDARHVPAELPQLLGPEGAQRQVAERYLTLRERLAESGLRVVLVAMDSRGAWRMQLANGVEVRLGRRDVDGRIERFVMAASGVLAEQMSRISYVDMRYSNGFSVGWSDTALAREGEQGEVSG